MNTKQLLDEADGYIKLGLNAESEATLRNVQESDPAARDYAQTRLITLLMGLRRFQEASDLGMGLIERGIFSYYTIIKTSLAQHFMGKITEARETLRLVEKCGHRLEDDAYQMACFASRQGEFPEAMHWLLHEFRRSIEYHACALGDTDLAPFWSWFREHIPTLADAHLIIETPFKDVCAAARNKDAVIELSPDDLTKLDERWQRLFRYDFAAGRYFLSPLAVASDQEAADSLVRLRAAGAEAVELSIRCAHARATDVVLDAQVRYATEHARAGNHLAARHHILWSLPLRPTLTLDFFNEPGLEMMTPFLTEIILANQEDSTFEKRMQGVWDFEHSDPDRAWKLLEETPESLRTTGLFQLRLAGLYNAEKDYERALPVWAELRLLWPNDAAAFGNAIAALQILGRDDEARRLLGEAPACYRRFRLYWNQVSALEHTGFQFPAQRIGKFRGRPDLGGLLIPEPDFDFKPDAETEPGTSTL